MSIGQAFTLIYALRGVGAGWSFSIYVLFLLDQGLTLFEANTLNFAFMAANFILDAPTGVLADRMGQRKVYIAGQLIWATAMLVYGTGTGFWQFLAAELTAALGSSLVSGSLDSWVRNELGEVGAHRALSSSMAILGLASIPSAIAGGVIGTNYGFAIPWIIGGLVGICTTIVSAVVLARFPERKVRKGEILSLKGVAWHTLSNGSLRFTIVISVVYSVFSQPYNMFWAPVFRDLSGESWWLGSVWAGITGGFAFGSHLVGNQWWVRLNGRGMALAIAIIGLPMLFSNLTGNVFVVVGLFLVHEVGRGALNPLMWTYANKHIPNDIRSTANSIRTSLGTLGAAIGLLLSGYLTLSLSPLIIWTISGLGLVILALYAYIRKE